MANQIQATVYQIDGNPLNSPKQISFLTSDILMRVNSLSTIAEVQSSITYYPNTSNQLQDQTFFVSESLGDLLAAANVGSVTQIQAQVLDINGDPQIPGGVTFTFPADAISMWETIDGLMQVNSTIHFKNKTYGVSDSLSSLVAQSNASAYKVYTALLTQSGGSDVLTLFPGNPLVIGVTYTITGYAAGDDFSNVGGPPPSNEGDYWSGYSFCATGTSPLVWTSTGLNYDTGAPVVTVLENTIGNIWWTYDNVGSYYAKSDDLFTEDKTFVLLTLGGGNDVILYGERVTSNMVGVYSDTFTESVELNGTFQIEIRVYN